MTPTVPPPRPDEESLAPHRAVVRGAATPTRVSSEVLFAGAKEVLIVHHGSLYRLKQTSLGKLILTK